MAVIEGQHVSVASSTEAASAPSDAKLLGHCMRLFYRARSHRRPLVMRWLKNYNVLHNKTWGAGRDTWQPSPEPPEIKPIVAALVAWKTDTEPIFDCLPQANPYSPFYDFYATLSDDLSTCLKSGWQLNQVDAEIEKMLWDGDTYGIGFLKTTWDQGLHNGAGNFAVKRIDPFSLYVDPNATCMDDATFFVEVRNMPTQEVARRWPDVKLNPADATTQQGAEEAPTRLSGGARGTAPLANPGAINGTGASTYGLPGQGRDHLVEDAGTTIFEFWLRRPVKAPVSNMDPDAPTPGTKVNPNADLEGDTESDTPAEEKLDAREEVYDAWRCVVIAGNQVLMDSPATDLWAHGQHPYDRYVPEDTGEFYGDSLVELLTPMQISINRTLAAIEQGIWLAGNPVMLEKANSGIPRTKVTNRPGQRISVNGDVNNAVRWLDPPQIHPNIANELVHFYVGEMERISGLSAIVRGATPTGRNAQGVLDSVQEAAFVRVRMSLRNMERTLIGSGNKAASNVAEFYDTARVVSLVGPGGEQTSRAIKGAHFYVPTDEGRVPLNFQIRIDIGSQQATSRSARVQEAMGLFQAGILDGEAALEMMNVKGWQKIAARMKSNQIAQGTYGLPPGARASQGKMPQP